MIFKCVITSAFLNQRNNSKPSIWTKLCCDLLLFSSTKSNWLFFFTCLCSGLVLVTHMSLWLIHALHRNGAVSSSGGVGLRTTLKTCGSDGLTAREYNHSLQPAHILIWNFESLTLKSVTGTDTDLKASDEDWIFTSRSNRWSGLWTIMHLYAQWPCALDLGYCSALICICALVHWLALKALGINVIEAGVFSPKQF